jgi:ABC-2 type transport system ATP-binding protein
MDEAERCNRVAYISYGNLLASGTVDEVLKNSKLTTWEVTSLRSEATARQAGGNLHEFAEKIRGKPGVEQVVAFGSTLHVSGLDAEKLRASVSPLITGDYRWKQIPSGLEDVFISLMETGKDNYS